MPAEDTPKSQFHLIVVTQRGEQLTSFETEEELIKEYIAATANPDALRLYAFKGQHLKAEVQQTTRLLLSDEAGEQVALGEINK